MVAYICSVVVTLGAIAPKLHGRLNQPVVEEMFPPLVNRVPAVVKLTLADSRAGKVVTALQLPFGRVRKIDDDDTALLPVPVVNTYGPGVAALIVLVVPHRKSIALTFLPFGSNIRLPFRRLK